MTGWVIHDLRLTFASGLASLGVRLEVTERLLNHVSNTQSGLVCIYQRYNFWPEMQGAMRAWNERIATQIAVD